MRPSFIILSLLLLVVIGGGLVIGFMPLAPATSHVEQRIPDAQIPR